MVVYNFVLIAIDWHLNDPSSNLGTSLKLFFFHRKSRNPWSSIFILELDVNMINSFLINLSNEVNPFYQPSCDNQKGKAPNLSAKHNPKSRYI